MPAATATEARYTVSASSSYIQIDIAGRGGAAPTNRYKVRIVNTHASDRLYIATGADPGSSVLGEVCEADYGVWEDFIESTVPIYARTGGSTAIYIIVRQYALS